MQPFTVRHLIPVPRVVEALEGAHHDLCSFPHLMHLPVDRRGAQGGDVNLVD